ncbi:hypothetical protein [Megasphaera cerevisiae]|uniref:hypothetical protein n=1 Tax=Megasphaera cerevisiae TaxID=39029 RepID=UPI0009C7E5A3|nr:hypothetical protein [Megasphaera cerevisiae]SKA22813.1 hypothetical protein SAMN05660900_02910 [Megasphaera cerevisiae DSM 20462]
MKHKVSKKQRQAWYAGLSCALLLWMTAPVMAAESPVGGGQSLGNNTGCRRGGGQG